MRHLVHAAGALAALVVLGHAGSAVAEAPPPDAVAVTFDAVAVTFKEPVGDRFVGMLHTVMGTRTLRKAGALSYVFAIGPRGNQNDYALFFAHLPYVSRVEPAPRLSAAERELPGVVVGVSPATRGNPSPAPGAPAAPRGYVPGQLLIRPLPDTAPAQLEAFHQELGAHIKEHIDGIDVYLLTLPPGLSVEEAQRRYMGSGLVQYAEPNRTMTIAPQPSAAPEPADNFGPGVWVSPDRLMGTHVLVRYRVGGPLPELINQIYGTRSLERTDADEARLAIPANVSPLVESRILRLCPAVSSAEPAYGR